MLLYAKTDEEITPNMEVVMNGNKIMARSLDLNCEFSEIVKKLEEISSSYFADSSMKGRISWKAKTNFDRFLY